MGSSAEEHGKVYDRWCTGCKRRSGGIFWGGLDWWCRSASPLCWSCEFKWLFCGTVSAAFCWLPLSVKNAGSWAKDAADYDPMSWMEWIQMIVVDSSICGGVSILCWWLCYCCVCKKFCLGNKKNTDRLVSGGFVFSAFCV